MGDQLTKNAEALRLFFTEEVYLVAEEEQRSAAVNPIIAPAAAAADQVLQEDVAVAPLAVATVPPAAGPADPAAKHVAPPVFKYLGKNQKNVLILVHDPANDVSSERGRELLRNLVKAMQLSATDFALLNYAAHTAASFETLQGFFSSRLILAFGVSAAQLGLDDFPQHKLVSQGATQLVFTGNLDLLSVDQEGKKVLWGSLKQITI